MIGSAVEASIRPDAQSPSHSDEILDSPALALEYARLRDQVEDLASRLRKSDQRRTALQHLIEDFNAANQRLARQRKAMLHILSDYEQDRRRLMQQTERLDNSRRALLHILQDSHRSNLRLEASRKAMIHMMGDLRDTTAESQQREQQLREKQEQLVQAAKLATLGELTTGVAHELNNPLNNIGLFIGNVIDVIELAKLDRERMLGDLRRAMEQVHKASQIIAHLRTFGRTAPSSREPVSVNTTILRALSLLQEQLRLREIDVHPELAAEDPFVQGNAIQLEQVFLNLLTNARDALVESPCKEIHIRSALNEETIKVVFEDTGPGVSRDIERRVFDPFFTTKDVGAGTGLGLSIAYGIVRDHQGTIRLENAPGKGAAFCIELPLMTVDSSGGERA